MTTGGRFLSPPCRVVCCEIWGHPMLFTLTNPHDVIQRHHLAGQFYEQEELEIMRRFCPPGAVYCDIGANIGNHALFALRFMHVREAILFEPNPVAIAVLVSNLHLNGVMDRVRTEHLGVGLSDAAAEGLTMQVVMANNLGGARMVSNPGGQVRAVAGDTVLEGRQVDFIKIDVEGMEMRVLAGLERTIARCRPVIFVEVDEANREAFGAWVRRSDYSVKARHRRYPVNENFLLQPKVFASTGAGTALDAEVTGEVTA